MNNQKQFEDFTYNTKCNIWRISFNNTDKEYALKDYYSDEYNITIYDNDKMYNGICINNLNRYYGELCTMYYVWKNNLKSDIVGFDQYRRQWHDINFDKINNDKIQVYSYWNESNSLINNNDLGYFLYHFIMYIKFYYPQYNDKLNYLLFKYPEIKNHINIFICKWEIFDKICNIVFGFLDYIMPNKQWLKKNIIKEYIDFNSKINIIKNQNFAEYILYSNRYIILLIEILYGTIFNLISDSFDYGQCSNCYILYNCNNEDDFNNIMKTYTYNVGNGIDFIFINNEDKFIKYFNNIVKEDLCTYQNIFSYNDYSIRNHAMLNWNVDNIKTNGYKIKLNKNEYVYADSSIELHKGNYIIKTI